MNITCKSCYLCVEIVIHIFQYKYIVWVCGASFVNNIGATFCLLLQGGKWKVEPGRDQREQRQHSCWYHALIQNDSHQTSLLKTIGSPECVNF